MKKILLIFILFLTIIVFSCNNYRYNELNKDKLINKYFNKDEIEDLEKILHFFEDEICKERSNDIKECYHNFLEKAEESYKNKNFGISKEKQKGVLNSISKTTYGKIWYNGFSIKNNCQDTVDIIMIKPESVYMDFLKDINKSYIEEYYYTATDIGISAGSINFMINHYNRFNLKDEKEKLIIAIHYLTFNDQL